MGDVGLVTTWKAKGSPVCRGIRSGYKRSFSQFSITDSVLLEESDLTLIPSNKEGSSISKFTE